MADINDPIAKKRRADVRELLCSVWGEQSCQIEPDDWPRVLELLLRDCGPSNPYGHARASLKPLVDEAVAKLLDAFFADVPPTDPLDAVCRSFPRLDREHCKKLAERLIEARP